MRGRGAWMGVDWRSHQRWVHVDGRAVNVIEIGQGPPVVLIHGLGGNWQSWLEVLPVVAALGHRVIALDLPGFGHSETPRERPTIPGFGRCVDAVLHELDTGPAAVVGNSMGGFIAAEIAIQEPARVDRLTLVSAAALWNERIVARPLVAASKVTRLYAPLLASRWELMARLPRVRNEALKTAGIRNPEEIGPQLAYEMLSGAGRQAFTDALQGLYDYRIRDRLPEIACPTLVVWGAEDPLVPLRHAFEYEQLIPHARVVVFPRTGHLPQVEQPERFNSALEAFLKD
jgi:pimeloyl-ACP methyl ester carboxylesterase